MTKLLTFLNIFELIILLCAITGAIYDISRDAYSTGCTDITV